MQDENLASVMTVENAARRFHELTITRFAELSWAAAASRMIRELPDMVEDAFDELGCRRGVFQCDVVRYRIQIGQRRLGPDYFSHLERRFLAPA